MSESSRESARDLASGYVLGALSSEESHAFEAALAGSPELQREVAEFRELSALLALQEERAPAAELKQRLRERIGAMKVSQLPSPAAGDSARRRSAAPVLLGMGLAAALLLSLGLYLRVRNLTGALAEREQQLARRETTLNAILEPAVQLTTLTATGAAPPVAQIFWNRKAHSIIVHTFQLKPAPEGRVYQLWLMRKNGKPIPSQVFNTEPSGHQLVQGVSVPAGEEINGFALTVEPAGGSPQPTTTPILFGSVAGT